MDFCDFAEFIEVVLKKICLRNLFESSRFFLGKAEPLDEIYSCPRDTD
jgi:hypothetical protein